MYQSATQILSIDCTNLCQQFSFNVTQKQNNYVTEWRRNSLFKFAVCDYNGMGTLFNAYSIQLLEMQIESESY